EQLLLRVHRTGHIVEVDLLELLHPLEPLVHGAEVREHAAQPTLVDVGHADACGLLGHRLLGLLLGADEQDRAPVGDGLLDELVRAVDVRQRLLQVDDVDAVALGEDEALHLGVPAARLVPEVDTALEQLAHGHDGHGTSFRRGPAGSTHLQAAVALAPAAFRLSDRTEWPAPLVPCRGEAPGRARTAACLTPEPGQEDTRSRPAEAGRGPESSRTAGPLARRPSGHRSRPPRGTPRSTALPPGPGHEARAG